MRLLTKSWIRVRYGRRLGVGAVALLVAGFGLVGQAVGATGDLSYDGCISNDGSGGACIDAPGSPLSQARGVAVSPDGKSVYVASAGSSTVTHFFAAVGGQLTYDGCVSNDGSGGTCADAAGTPLSGAEAVAVSPDGRSVYVASPGSDAVAHFFAAAGGQLTYDGCVSHDGSGGTCAVAASLLSANAVAVSPDGKSVYVAAEGAVVHFFAAPAGQLTYDGCVSNDGSGGTCADAPGTPLLGADAVAVSPDGKSVYVTSASSGTITHFFAAPGGQLTYDGCVSNGGSGGACADAHGNSLEDPDAVAVSPDGKSVYVTAGQPGAVTHFFAAAGGQLTFDGCISNDGSGGACADAPGSPIDGAAAAAVSPDGKSLYVASSAAGTLSTFAAATASGGQLTYASCVSDDGDGGACAAAPGSPLLGTAGVAVNAQGTAVYATGYGAGTLTHFFRAGNGAGGGSGSTGGGSGSTGGAGATGGSGATTPALTSLTITPFAFVAAPGGPSVIVQPSSRKGAEVAYQLNVAATVRFVFQHAVPGRRQRVNGRTRCVVQTHKNAHAGLCARYVTVGSLTQAGKAGADSFRFSGRLSVGKLPVGSYILVATPSTAAGTGRSVQVTFRIKR